MFVLKALPGAIQLNKLNFQVMFARDGVITALDTHVAGIKAPVEPESGLFPLQHSLDLFELMGAGDACFLVELLKLAVRFYLLCFFSYFIFQPHPIILT